MHGTQQSVRPLKNKIEEKETAGRYKAVAALYNKISKSCLLSTPIMYTCKPYIYLLTCAKFQGPFYYIHKQVQWKGVFP